MVRQAPYIGSTDGNRTSPLIWEITDNDGSFLVLGDAIAVTPNTADCFSPPPDRMPTGMGCHGKTNANRSPRGGNLGQGGYIRLRATRCGFLPAVNALSSWFICVKLPRR